MFDHIERIRSLMTEEDREELSRIFAPTAVATPPDYGAHALTVQPDGEIRCYGSRAVDENDPFSPREPIYIASRDGGLTWKTHKANPATLGVFTESPYSDRQIAAAGNTVRIAEHGDADTLTYTEQTLPASPFQRPLLPLRSVRRWLYFGSWSPPKDDPTFDPDSVYRTCVFYSDDDGDTWERATVPTAPAFVAAPPHEGPRWANNGVEPTVAELSDGTLLMMLRTSTDVHYMSRSFDHGTTWTAPEPTPFHSTLTMPELYRLRDGRLLFFFCNTRPLPECDKESYFPPLSADAKSGYWEDVFTNRDACHLAISEDDGKTWKGLRELWLNPLRNQADFRSCGGQSSCNDKSVHQSQMLELPGGKVLIHFGQHEQVAKLVIFDVNWLYETARSEDFRMGLGRISTQVYVKSVSGGVCRPFPGHCAWNRTDGALLVPDPCGDHSEALLLRNTADERLWNGVQGAVWNFPALHRGKVHVRFMIRGEGMRLSLLDHWMNPSDTTVPMYANASFLLLRAHLPVGEWLDATVTFDTDGQTAALTCGGQTITAPWNGTAPYGVCYLHLQTATADGDPDGVLIKCFSAEE